MYTTLVPPHADMQRLDRRDYNTDDNMHSPEYALYDIALQSVFLNDEIQLQMFEKPPVNPEIGTYTCYIAPVKRYKRHETNENNIVNASCCSISSSMG
jgi:hypothetical protein